MEGDAGAGSSKEDDDVAWKSGTSMEVQRNASSSMPLQRNMSTKSKKSTMSKITTEWASNPSDRDSITQHHTVLTNDDLLKRLAEMEARIGREGWECAGGHPMGPFISRILGLPMLAGPFSSSSGKLFLHIQDREMPDSLPMLSFITLFYCIFGSLAITKSNALSYPEGAKKDDFGEALFVASRICFTLAGPLCLSGIVFVIHFNIVWQSMTKTQRRVYMRHKSRTVSLMYSVGPWVFVLFYVGLALERWSMILLLDFSDSQRVAYIIGLIVVLLIAAWTWLVGASYLSQAMRPWEFLYKQLEHEANPDDSDKTSRVSLQHPWREESTNMGDQDADAQGLPSNAAAACAQHIVRLQSKELLSNKEARLLRQMLIGPSRDVLAETCSTATKQWPSDDIMLAQCICDFLPESEDRGQPRTSQMSCTGESSQIRQAGRARKARNHDLPNAVPEVEITGFAVSESSRPL